ncbi:MAG TPA: TadE family protein [Microlunatus sp.]|nr:TadE family protein [Microlunatus sp.]
MRPQNDERGLTESVQHAVLFPLLMLVTLGIIQTGIWLHGHHVAERAATAGADLARGRLGSVTDARATAGRLAAAGGLEDVTVRVRRAGGVVEVEVSGRAPLILDLGLSRISERASAPVEKATRP